MAETTKTQRKAAAGHSQAHRDRKREAGIPTGRQIDTALAGVLIRVMYSRKGLQIHAGNEGQLVERAIRLGGWPDSEEVRDAVRRRVGVLRTLTT